MFHAVIMLITTCFGCTLYYFYAFSGTNLLTRCQSASSVFASVFGFRKSYTENIVKIGGNLFLRTYNPQKVPSRPSSSISDRGSSDVLPGTLPEGRSSPEGSTSTCLPPVWCVSCSSLDYRSIVVARWLSSPLVPPCLDLVSFLSWSRSSYCNATDDPQV